jgi:hypothetical protein
MATDPRVLVFWHRREVLDEKDFATLDEAVSYVEQVNGVTWDPEHQNYECTAENPEAASFRQGGRVIASWSLENGLRLLEEVLTRIKKLLDTTRYAGNGSGSITEAEVDLATERLQKLLAEFNVDAAMIDALQDPRIPVEERRIEKDVERLWTYDWQERLWRTIAHCNFCLYYTKHVYKDYQTPDPRKLQYCWTDEEKAECPKIWVSRVVGKRHCLVGRESNVLSVEVLGNYIENALLRLSPYPVTHKLANSWKKGASERVRERLLERKRKLERESVPLGPSSSTALSLRDVFKSEYDKNIDVMYGEGTSARWAAEEQEAKVKQAQVAERKEMMEDCPQAFSREEYNAAVKEWARQKKAAEKLGTRRTRRDDYWDNVDMSAWYEGQKAGDKVGLDPQVGTGSRGGIE